MTNFMTNFCENMKGIAGKWIHNSLMFIVIPLVGFFLDYASKVSVIYNICIPRTTVKVLPFFDIVCVLNTGVSFGFLSGIENGKVILLTMTIAILCFIFFIMYKEKNTFVKYCYSVIISGAMGNIYDRLIHGGVIDFLDFFVNNHHYPAFNVADSLIFIGICGIFGHQFFTRKK